jgi:integrase
MANNSVPDPNLDYHPFKNKKDDCTATRENSLSEDEYERLLEGARSLDDFYAREAEVVILLAGRLGLRGGEIAHMKHHWLDTENHVISIPAHEPCDKGKDGGICGYCRQAAKQISEYNDITAEEAEQFFWKGKTEKAEREVPYGFHDRCVELLPGFFERFGEYYNSRQAINRRVDAALEAADGLTVADTTPHGLRATAASHLVSKGLNAWSLQHFMGWAWPNTAQHYVRDDAKQLSTTLGNLPD